MSTSLEATANEIRTIAARLAGREPEALSGDEPVFAGGLEFDSMTAAALLAEIEERFGVAVAEVDIGLDSLQSLDALARLVASLR